MDVKQQPPTPLRQGPVARPVRPFEHALIESWRWILHIHEKPIRCLLPSQAFRWLFLVRSIRSHYLLHPFEQSFLRGVIKRTGRQIF